MPAPAPPSRARRSAYILGDREPTYRGEFWVYAEPEGEGVRSVSLELVGVARGLANCLGEKVGAVLATDDAGSRPETLIAAGADVVYVLEHPLLADFDPIAHKEALAALVLERKPQAMLFGASPLGRELAPRVAYACRCGLTADCTQLEIGDYQKGSTNLVAILEQTRPALGGNVMATIMTKDSQTQMATVRPASSRCPSPTCTASARSCGRRSTLDESDHRPRGHAGRVVREQGLHPRCGGHHRRRARLPLEGRLRALPRAARGGGGQAPRGRTPRWRPRAWPSRTAAPRMTSRSARPARPSSHGSTSRSASPVPSSTSRACSRPRSSWLSTRTPRPRSSTTRTSASSATSKRSSRPLTKALEVQA